MIGEITLVSNSANLKQEKNNKFDPKHPKQDPPLSKKMLFTISSLYSALNSCK